MPKLIAEERQKLIVLLQGIAGSRRIALPDKNIGKIFMHGRSQAVRLPIAFRLPGDRVRVRRVEGGVLLEPVTTDADAWFSEMDRISREPFMPEGRNQPPMPAVRDHFG